MATKKAAAKVNGLSNLNVVFSAPKTTITAPEEYQENFRVRRQVADRVSQPVLLQSMAFSETAREIRVFCADGNTRRCKVDRLPTIQDARILWKKLQDLGSKGEPVQFRAAGGFSPDVWFYDAE